MKTKLIVLFFMFAFVLSAAGISRAQGAARAESKTDASRSLSAAQKKAIKAIQVESEKKAAPVALRLAGIVKRIYDNMLAETPDEELRAKLSEEMKQAAWELLMIKGLSIHDIVNVLTPEQKRLVKVEMTKPDAPADLSEVIARIFNLSDK